MWSEFMVNPVLLIVGRRHSTLLTAVRIMDVTAEMKNSTFLQRLCPKVHEQVETLPVLGELADAYLCWLSQREYTRSSLRNHVASLRRLSRWLVRRRVTSLSQLSQQLLFTAHRHFLRWRPRVGGTVGALRVFLREQRAVPEDPPSVPCPSECELARFGAYLRRERGLAEGTILAHQRRLRPFFAFIRYDRSPHALPTLRLEQIEAFLKHASRTNNRFSLQHVVAALRIFLKAQHAQGVLLRPLHQQIDTPRVYRLERIPRALSWTQVRSLLGSIDRASRSGRRDFTMLYLAAAYGLRSSEIVRLRMDDIDWRGAELRVRQSKIGRSLRLPLTDEAAKVLIDYLRHRPRDGDDRELFLRARAPRGPLAATAVNDVLEKRARESGLTLPKLGSHVLRHSFAVHLLRRGTPIKAIGDALGHRDPESTAVYLRLALKDLREVGLPVPRAAMPRTCPKTFTIRQLPAVRSRSWPPRVQPIGFSSILRAALRRYLDLKRAMGRRFRLEEATLKEWDGFLHRRHRDLRVVCAEMFNDWAAGLSHLSPTVRRNRMRIVRNFLLFHARLHPKTFIPDILTFPKAAPPRPPRLVTETEMAAILDAASQLGVSHFNPLRAQTLRLALVLLFCCGLRLGELLRLKLRDFDPVQRLLRIEATKFHKSRLIPLSASVLATVNEHLGQRRARDLAAGPESFLIWCGRRPEPHGGYTAPGFRETWLHLCLSVDVLDDRGRPPRLHDLRHSFAVLALQRWYASGIDVQAKLPHLAGYLGHVSPVSTHYYLQLTPTLRAAASERFHRRFGHALTNGGVQ
jgi:integrase/recombinase XerD